MGEEEISKEEILCRSSGMHHVAFFLVSLKEGINGL